MTEDKEESLEEDEEEVEEMVECINNETHQEHGVDKEIWTTKKTDEIDAEDWKCSLCEDINIALIEFIKKKIDDTQTESGDWVKFVLRELVQNADDAGAEILTLKLTPEELAVVNDGEPFLTEEEDHFQKIKNILNRTKEYDKTKTGNFGSGFQTVYAMTNTPEVHSSNVAIRMNPVTGESENIPCEYEDDEGVLFRFPWRTDKEAKEFPRDRDRSPFEDISDWPRWSLKLEEDIDNRYEIGRLYDYFKDYLHDVLICCRSLKKIRIIKDLPEDREVHQVEKDFTLGPNSDEFGSLVRGKMEWNSSFEESEGLTSEREMTTIKNPEKEYMINTSEVMGEEGKPLHMVKKEEKDQGLAIKEDVQRDEIELKENLVHLLLPQFVKKDESYIYSVIPLPRKTENRFICSAHLFPDEERKDINIKGKKGEWYINVLKTLKNMHSKGISEVVDRWKNREDTDTEELQRILMDCVPGADLSEWFRPGKERTELEKKESFEKTEDDLKEDLWRAEIIVDDESEDQIEFLEPEEVWLTSGDPIEDSIVRFFDETPLNEEVKNHENYDYLKDLFEDRREFTPKDFQRLWTSYKNKVTEDDSRLEIGIDDDEYSSLDKEMIKDMVRYLKKNESVFKTEDDLQNPSSFELLPSKTEELKAFEDFYGFPEGYENSLQEFFPSSYLFHSDFNELIEDLDLTSWMTPLDEQEIPKKIHEIKGKYQDSFDGLGEKDHRLISDILVRLCGEESQFALKNVDPGTEFIPYEVHGEVYLGKPNEDDGEPITKTGPHAPENYDRDAIYSDYNEDLSLPQECLEGIRFLSLKVEKEDVEKVIEGLYLMSLSQRSFSLNFLSPSKFEDHGSIMEKNELSELTRIDDEEKLDELRYEITQGIVKDYFSDVDMNDGEYQKSESGHKRKDLEDAPILYNEEGDFIPGKEFVINIPPGKKAGYFDHESLHDDFESWKDEALIALGAKRAPSIQKIYSKIVNEWIDGDIDRKKLSWTTIYLSCTKKMLDDRPPVDLSAFEDDEKKEGTADLKKISWIPTEDGGLKKPTEAIVPFHENMKALGDNHPNLFDPDGTESFLEDMEIPSKGDDSDFKERAKKIGLLLTPQIEHLLDVIEKRKKDSKTPPSDIFECLQKRLIEKEQGEDIKDIERSDYDLGFYQEEKGWIDEEDIYVTNQPEDVPSQLKEGLHINPHDDLDKDIKKTLNFIGKTRLNPDRILKEINTLVEDEWVCIEPETWAFLKKRINKDDMDDENLKALRERWKDKKLLLKGGEAFSPEEIILDDKEVYQLSHGTDKFEITDSYILISLEDEDRSHVLSRLGARTFKELKKQMEEVKRLMICIGDRNILSDDLQKIRLDLLTHLLDYFHEPGENDLVFDRSVKVPAEKEGEKLVSSDQCYIKDHPAWRKFEGKLYFFQDVVDGRKSKSLRDFGEKNDIKSFDEALEIDMKEVDEEETKSDKEQSRRLTVLSEALQDYMDYHAWDYNTEEDLFHELEEMSVKRTDSLEMDYGVDEETLTEETYFFLDVEKDDGATLYLLEDIPIEKVDELSENIYDYISPEDIPRDKEQKIKSFMSRLLLKPTGSWDRDNEELKDNSYGEGKPLGRMYPDDLGHRKNYLATRKKFMRWYQDYGCQICEKVTPEDESGTPRETVRCVFSLSGGRYTPREPPERYEPGNSLYLCPRHSVMFERGLVEIGFLETDRGSPSAMKKSIEDSIKDIRNSDDEYISTEELDITVTDFDAVSDMDKGEIKTGWEDKPALFKKEHLEELLERSLNYISEKEDQGDE